jgi:hypothetical protein
MTSSNTSSKHPFWEDEPYLYYAPPTVVPSLPSGFLKLYVILIIVLLLLAPGLALAVIYIPLALGWIIFLALMLSLSYYQIRRRKFLIARVNQIQEEARLHTQASCIGSAVHVAGHPLLARDQAVVLALKGDLLSIFSYDSPSPIDSLPVNQLLSVYTVVYDDERVPHLEAIDSTAQALQITFSRSGENCTCLFRHMRKVRPIDWYHAIQQARFKG